MKSVEKPDRIAVTSTPSNFLTTSVESPRTTRIGIANIHKKFYPMNLTLNTSPLPKVQKPKKQLAETHPDYISEYLNRRTKDKFMATCRIDNKNSFGSSMNEPSIMNQTYYRDLHPPVSLVIPPISYDSVKNESMRNSEGKDPKIYQPSTIYFSNRSKMVIYTHSPLCYEPPSMSTRVHVIIPTLRTDYFRLKAKKAQELKADPMKFNENIKRLKEIIKDPLIYEH